MEYFASELPILFTIITCVGLFFKVGLPQLVPIVKLIIEPFQKIASAMEKNSDSLERVTKIVDSYEARCKSHQSRIKNKLDKLAIKQDISELDELFLDIKEEINDPIGG